MKGILQTIKDDSNRQVEPMTQESFMKFITPTDEDYKQMYINERKAERDTFVIQFFGGDYKRADKWLDKILNRD